MKTGWLLPVLLFLLCVAPSRSVEEKARLYRPWLPGTTPEARAGEPALVAVAVMWSPGPGRLSPLPGARVACYTEDVRPVSLRSRLVAETRADRFGIANLTVPAGEAYHWLVEADGFGVLHDYAGPESFTGAKIVLEPGTDRRLRVIGPFGKPLPDARVELVLGCPHSPAARTVRTDEHGLTLLPNVTGDGWDLWIVAPGVRPGPYSLPPAPCDGSPAEILTRWGGTATGRVVDPAGKPVARAVVRELSEFRGPAVETGPDGGFTLHGLSGRPPLGVYRPGSPFAPRPDALVRGFTEGVPLRIVLRPDRPVALGEGEPRHRLDVVLEDADMSVPLRAVRPSDGLTFTGRAGFWTASFDLPPGTWRITAGGGITLEAPVTATVQVPAPRGEPVRIALRGRQAAFGVRPGKGERPRWGELRIPGRSVRFVLASGEWIPAAGPAALVLDEPYERILPVPPAEKGRRLLEIPPPGEVRVTFRVKDRAGRALAPRVEVDSAATVKPRRREDGRYDLVLPRGGDTCFIFGAEGCLDRDLDVVLPRPPAEVDLGEIVLLPESAEVTRTFRVVRGDGTPVPGAELRVPGGFPDGVEADEEGNLEVDLRGETRAAVTAEGFLPMPVVLSPKSAAVLRFPAGSLAIEVRDESGNPLAATACLDGWWFSARDGRIRVSGVPAGKHRLLVGASGYLGVVREITTGGKERREVSLELPRRSP